MQHSNCFSGRIKFLMTLSFTGLFLCTVLQLQAQDLEKDIIGKWLMVSNGDGFLGGHILFKDGGTYQYYRKWPDGSGAEIAGGYELDSDSNPARLKLCLGDCGAAGSEWTTNFGIIRSTEGNQLEMYFSSDGSFPDNFPKDIDAKGMCLFQAEH